MHAIHSAMGNIQNLTKKGSRYGKSAICFFVKPEKKRKIIAALATSGYGSSFQEGITNLLDSLIDKTFPKALRLALSLEPASQQDFCLSFSHTVFSTWLQPFAFLLPIAFTHIGGQGWRGWRFSAAAKQILAITNAYLSLSLVRTCEPRDH